MSNQQTPIKKKDGSMIFKATGTLTKRFNETQRINAQTTQSANEYIEAIREEYSQEVYEMLTNTFYVYEHFKMDPSNEDQLDEFKRQVLDIKSTAGMFGFPVITMIAELLFEVFDKGYNLQNERVLKSIELYLQTLQSVLERDLKDPECKYAVQLTNQFSELNQSLEAHRL